MSSDYSARLGKPSKMLGPEEAPEGLESERHPPPAPRHPHGLVGEEHGAQISKNHIAAGCHVPGLNHYGVTGQLGSLTGAGYSLTNTTLSC